MKPRPFIICDLAGGGYHIFVSLEVEGKRARFLIDTGASSCVVDRLFYESKLGRKMKVVKKETTGVHSTVMESYSGSLKLLKIGAIEYRRLYVAGVELSHVNMTYKKLGIPPIHGIIGSDLMLKYGWILNYRDKQIEFS